MYVPLFDANKTSEELRTETAHEFTRHGDFRAGVEGGGGLSSWGVNAGKETVLYEGPPLHRFPSRSHPTREPETRRQVSHHELVLVREEGFYDLYIYIYFFP